MKRLARALVVMVSLGVIGSVVSLVPQGPAVGAGGAPVNIVSPLPLPVTGNVNATVSGTVAAQQSGTWNVGFASGAAVSINNQAGAPVPTQAVAAGPLTHVGRLPSEHVTLLGDTQCSGPGIIPSTYGFDSVSPDGSFTSCFALQNGQALVITDVFWQLSNQIPGITDGLVLKTGGGNAGPGPRILVSLGTANADGSAGGSEHLTGGLVFTQASQPTYIGARGTSPNTEMQGYLISFR